MPPIAAVSPGLNQVCTLSVAGVVDCGTCASWGECGSPAGRFVSVSAGSYLSCAISTTSALFCFGLSGQAIQFTLPGQFSAVSVGYDRCCGLTTSGTLVCQGQGLTPPSGVFSRVSCSHYYCCAIQSPSGIPTCFGTLPPGVSEIPGASVGPLSPRFHYRLGNRNLPCNAGTLSAGKGSITPLCSGVCEKGTYSPVTSAQSQCLVCGVGHYCPAASANQSACDAGRYGLVTGLFDKGCSGPCPIAHFCPAGSWDPTANPCPAGVFGNRTGLKSSECSGACTMGFYCPISSSLSTQLPCGEKSLYCPQGSGLPLVANAGGKTLDGPANLRTGTALCSTEVLPGGSSLVFLVHLRIRLECPAASPAPPVQFRSSGLLLAQLVRQARFSRALAGFLALLVHSSMNLAVPRVVCARRAFFKIWLIKRCAQLARWTILSKLRISHV